MFWLVFLCLIILGFSYIGYWITFYNPVSRHGEVVHSSIAAVEQAYQNMERLPCEQITIKSHDGLLLRGRYFHINDHGDLLIQFHGYRSTGAKDVSAINAVARKLGLNTLVVDQRAHGSSQGDTMTFGILERRDCQAWAKYAAERFGHRCRIFLSGVSMGAATVLMASELEMPEMVAGIIADCSYTSPGAIIRKVCNDMKLPGALMYPFVVLGGLIFGRFRIWAASPVLAVANSRKPILLIHGSEDHFVPLSMSVAIAQNCAAPCYLELFPGAVHAGCCMTDPGRYEKVLQAFVAECTD